MGHNVECSGYIFNDGEVVYISDFREILEESLELIKVKPEILIMPLTTPKGTRFHASLEDLLGYAERIEPKRMIINHMAVESDYAEVYSHCPRGIEPAYDGMEAIYASISSVAAITSTTFPQIALGIVTLAGAEKSYTFNVK